MIRAIPLMLLVTGCAAPPRQGGIVSTNPCADAILAQVAPDRLAAVSRYSHDAAATSMPLAIARRWPATAGTAEEVIARAPDLVVTDSFAPAATRAAYAEAGLTVLTLGSVATIADSERQVMQIATAAGRAARGRAMVAQIEQALSRHAVPGEGRGPVGKVRVTTRSARQRLSRTWAPASAGERPRETRPRSSISRAISPAARAICSTTC